MIKADELRGGRVLAFGPDLYLHEQWEADESDGFLDVRATPPTGTWLMYLDDLPEVRGGVLLSWVPAAFVRPVQRAINVNTSKCLVWLEDLPIPLAAEYRRAVQAQ